LGLVVAHILALHDVGSNNPDGIEIKGPNALKDADGHPLDGIPFHPYYSVHDLFGVAVFLMVFSAIIFFAPELGGYFLEYNNFIPADPLKTPAHIAPVWYFTPFYSMLRAITTEMMYALSAILLLTVGWVLLKTAASTLVKGLLVVLAVAFLWMFNAFAFTGIGFLQGIDAKFWGVVVMGGAVIILFFLPWLDKSPVKSIRYRPGWHKTVLGVFVVNFIVLAYYGVQPVTEFGTRLSQLGTIFYFGFFLLMPWWSRLGEFKPVPDRITFAAH
jgi:ubiquinol-cytochrome c reductase cytochrome b subunit